MDPLTLAGTVIGIAAAVAGLVAAIVQIREYREKRRAMADETVKRVQSPTSLPAPPIPHNLPPRSEFIGRETEKARVHEALRSRSYLVSIDGIGGIGKTVLALEVAHECLQASRGDGSTDGIATFDGYIWTTAKDRDLTLNNLLDTVALTLEYPGIAQHPLQEKQTAVRKLLRVKPYLLIVDNFETITDEGVRDCLLELPEPSKALITTREQKLRQVWAVSLKGLTEPEGLALIRSAGRRLGLASLETVEDRVLLHLYQATGGTPLAIKWAVGQIKQKGQSLDTVLAALHEARGSVFDNIFSRSWGLLSVDARQVLIVMPLFTTSASREGIEATSSNVHHFALDEALGQLVEMSLVDATDELELARRRYSVHPLTRAFAAAKLGQEPQTRHAAQKRLAAFFRSFTKKHGSWDLEGFARLEPDLPNILAIIRWCWDQGLVKLGLNTTRNVLQFMINYGYWNDVMDLSKQAIRQATETGDELEAARLRMWPIGWIHRHRGDLDAAEEQTTLALTVLERIGEEQYIAHAKRYLGRIAQERGYLEQAERLLREALSVYQAVGDLRYLYLATANLADVALQRGYLETAWELCEGVLESARRLGDPERISHLVAILGGVARRRGDIEQTRAYWEEALALMRQANRRDTIADGQFLLAGIDVEIGQEQQAVNRLSEALEIYRRLDIQSKVQEVQTLLAELEGGRANE